MDVVQNAVPDVSPLQDLISGEDVNAQLSEDFPPWEEVFVR